MSLDHPRAMLFWLYLCAAMVFSMVVLGGAVRLTGSGLSMVDWQPLLGILPPLSQVEWESVFARYREYPEYQLVNQGMSLVEFKFIYYMEYLHRLLGRMVGVVFALPFFFWLARGAIPSWLKPRLWIALALGACQGVLGWYMVKSGLVDDPHVSQYRLTAHLLLAVFIFAWLLVLAFRLQWQGRILPLFESVLGRMRILGGSLIALVFVMIGTGGFMAGTKAGFIYNTWPRMGDVWMPHQVWSMVPWWRNLSENPMGVQFVHRWLAFIVLVAAILYAIAALRRGPDRLTRILAILLTVMVVLQVLLGIATLVMKVPLALGVIHQGGALLLLMLSLALWTRYRRGDEA